MDKEEIKAYRNILGNEFMSKDLEIETTLSYITVGALGFFLSFNESFLKLESSEYKILLFISIISLFVAFILILIRKLRTSYHDLKMIEFVDGMETDSKDDDQQLRKKWDNYSKELSRIRNGIYICLSAGVTLQIVFFIINLA